MCLAGSIILSAEGAAAGRISGLKETEQSFFYSVTSAAQIMREEIEGQEFQALYRRWRLSNPYSSAVDSEIKKILIDAVIEIYERKKAESGETLTFLSFQRDINGCDGQSNCEFYYDGRL